LKTFYPLPNFGRPGLTGSNYRTPVPQRVAADDLFVRVDYRFSDRHALFVRDMYDEGNRGNLFSGSLPTVGYRHGYRRDQNATLSDLFLIRPSLYNEFSVGFTRDHNKIVGSTSWGPDVSGLVEPSFPYPAMPLMSIQGFTNATQGDYQDIPENIILHDYGDLIETAAQAGYPTRLINFSAVNLGPRAALAWRPIENTVVRAGYGIFYDMNPPSTQATLDLYLAALTYPTNQIVNGVPLYRSPTHSRLLLPIPALGCSA
jgi:hypothetical protein